MLYSHECWTGLNIVENRFGLILISICLPDSRTYSFPYSRESIYTRLVLSDLCVGFNSGCSSRRIFFKYCIYYRRISVTCTFLAEFLISEWIFLWSSPARLWSLPMRTHSLSYLGLAWANCAVCCSPEAVLGVTSRSLPLSMAASLPPPPGLDSCSLRPALPSSNAVVGRPRQSLNNLVCRVSICTLARVCVCTWT